MKTRKQVIREIVKAYKKNNKEEYKAFLGLIKERRKKLKSKMLATFRDKKGRAAFSVPENIIWSIPLSSDESPS